MISIKRWELCGPDPKKVCENFSLKVQISNEYLKEGHLELIFQLTIILGTTEEEKNPITVGDSEQEIKQSKFLLLSSMMWCVINNLT